MVGKLYVNWIFVLGPAFGSSTVVQCRIWHLVKSWIRNVLACTIPGSQPWSVICTNYLMHGEFRKTIVAQLILMIAPYGRIIIMHISSIVAAFPVMALG